MNSFMIRFLICNVLISGIIGILLIAKRIQKNNLTNRMQYNLWFLLLGLLTIPFIPIQPIRFQQIIAWLGDLQIFHSTNTSTIDINISNTAQNETLNWMEDFALSVNSKASSLTGWILSIIWIVGIIAMIILVVRSFFRLHTLRKSALPLQNKNARKLYNQCLKESHISKNIPVYSTAFLKSPVIVGHLKPYIYLPIHTISDYKESELRYMLLHELQHYKHHDALL